MRTNRGAEVPNLHFGPRRATSHRRFCVRRRPNLRLAALYGNRTIAGDGGIMDRRQLGTADSSGAGAGAGDEAAGARTQRRRVDSGALFAAAAEAAPSLTAQAETGLQPPQHPQRPTNRRMRRRPAALQSATEASCASRDLAPQQQQQQQQQPQPARTPATPFWTLSAGAASDAAAAAGGDEAAAAATSPGEAEPAAEEEEEEDPSGGVLALRRLETHVWHARRMAMERRWGHVLASHAAGRGRGSRSLLAQLRVGALLHDSSYSGCVELRGHQRTLAGVMRRMSDPARLDELLDRPEVISGAAEWDLFLHSPGAFPTHPLAPVRALWLTPPTQTQTQPRPRPPTPEHSEDLSHMVRDQEEEEEEEVDADGWAPRCVLWLWVHAAAFGDVWAALHQAAAQEEAAAAAAMEQEAEVGDAPGADAGGGPGSGRPLHPPRVSIRSRCPDLRRIEVVGAAASAALARVLQPMQPMQQVASLSPTAAASAAPAAPAAAALKPSSSSGAGAAGGDSDAARPNGGGAGAGRNGDGSSLGGRLWCSVWERDCGGGGGGGEGGEGPRWQWRWPAGAVVGLVAADPRLAAPVAAGGGRALRADALAEAEAYCGGGGMGDDGGGAGGSWGRELGAGAAVNPRRVSECCVGLGLGEAELRRQRRQWPEAGDWTLGAAALWSSATAAPAAGVPPPLDQSQVAAVRQAARRRLLQTGLGLGLGLAGTSAAAPGRGRRADAADAPAAAAGERGSRELQRPGEGSSSGGGGGPSVSFPVLLIRRPESGSLHSGVPGAGGPHGGGQRQRQREQRRGRQAGQAGQATATSAGRESPGCGWSLVLPAGWVMPVWTALAYTGARPTGQSEWRQLAAHFRMPCFPYDHPYTPAGSRYNVEAAAELAAAASRRPRGRARRPADLGPVADWSRLMQPPQMPVRPLPSSLMGRCKPRRTKAGPASCTAGGGGGGAAHGGGAADRMEEDAAPASTAVAAVASRPGAIAGGGGGGEASSTAEGAVGATVPGAPDTDWSLALSRSTVRQFLFSGEGHGGGGGGGRGAGAAVAAAPGFAPRQQQQQQQRGQRQERGRQPASKDRLHGWTLRKAVRLGLLAPPGPPPTAAAPAAPAAVALPTAAPPLPAHIKPHQQQHEGQVAEGRDVSMAEGGGEAAASQPPRRRCLLYVALSVEGRGVCEAGAEVIGTVVGGNSPQGSGGAGADTGGQLADAHATQTEAPDVRLGADSRSAPSVGEAVVVGYVVSAATRGSSAYPGGLALCDAAGLARCLPAAPPGLGSPGARDGGAVHRRSAAGLETEAQAGAECVGAGGESGASASAGVGSWFGGAGEEMGMQGWGGRRGGGVRVLRLWVRNPGSDALRCCRAELLFPGGEPPLGM
ncbi:hypothetical protein PLESTB_001024500 [Pleodorina starrii]|uniref:POPLD domain-containing protein n=1 Tax=Pleodorina starrii TaxID=330485 RepID=A0A9W6BPG7_9CHLO|nr:hypothetical protein PLESTM_001817500 [Pleodorina starrii]GLC55748.1 hypothetical protein PLESTB_001024500 [Pleodorina starrii]GLC68820.1 hypothetical protein PLESTF_000742000 [Pleodorina starrii]